MSGHDGYEKRGMNEDDFGAKGGSIVSAFDAFPKAKPQYVTRTSDGGKWTIIMAVVSALLLWSEISRWWRGSETHNFAVEKGISHEMQINIDIVVHMQCNDLHINVQDAAGDRILAASRLTRDRTDWHQWVDGKGVHKLGHDKHGRVVTGEDYHDEGFGQEHVHDIVAMGKKRTKWAKTPRVWGPADSCRIYGSLDLNKVQGDFHITARGHGYMQHGNHLEHSEFNFSHVISEMSYGPYYPNLVNPLDRTVNMAPANFHKFQYYLSVVPTVYTYGSKTVYTNQYAVTEQSKDVNEMSIPGIFFKYDIEPILLSVQEERDGYFRFLFKLANVLSGVIVGTEQGRE
jgi:hypothetical protein